MNRLECSWSNPVMKTVTLTKDEYDALVAARDGAFAERESLRGEVRTLKVERDLLQEKLKAFLRKLFDAKSEARGTDQKDLFFNEAEALAPGASPVAEEETSGEIEIPAHKRKKRGRKPLDPNLPREIVRHELPESELAWSGERGLAARLKVEPQTPMTCQPFLLATAWTRKEKPLRMTAEPDAPTTWYVAIEGGLGEIATSTAEPQAADPPAGATESMAQKLGGDLGTAATLQVSRPGRYRVLAVATPPGAKAGLKDATVVASFAITVHGELHTGGCSK